jgi:hypothetical protein
MQRPKSSIQPHHKMYLCPIHIEQAKGSLVHVVRLPATTANRRHSSFFYLQLTLQMLSPNISVHYLQKFNILAQEDFFLPDILRTLQQPLFIEWIRRCFAKFILKSICK